MNEFLEYDIFLIFWEVIKILTFRNQPRDYFMVTFPIKIPILAKRTMCVTVSKEQETLTGTDVTLLSIKIWKWFANIQLMVFQMPLALQWTFWYTINAKTFVLLDGITALQHVHYVDFSTFYVHKSANTVNIKCTVCDSL